MLGLHLGRVRSAKKFLFWVGDSVDFWVFITDKESQCPILMSETHTLAKHTRTLLH